MSTGSARSPNRRRVLFGLTALTISIVVSLSLAEVAARLLGYRPYERPNYDIRIEPGGKYQARDPVLGYRHLPGQFNVTLPNGDTWQVTHLEDTLRITQPLEDYANAPDREGIWLFGCSFVHGWGLNDSETLGWLLQELQPNYEIVNFGVGGYGTWQMYLQYIEALEVRGEPKAAILLYASFHDERTTRSRNWRRATYDYDHLGPTAQPYLRLGDDDELKRHFDHAGYREFFLLRSSALMNLIDITYSQAEHKYLRSHRVAELVVEDFAEQSEQRGVHFVIVGLDRTSGTRSMLAFAEDLGITTYDGSANPRDPRNRIRFDPHPSGYANQQRARVLSRGINRLPRGAKKR
jgi:hypothetical protein